jgi:hypothetical protein
MMPPMKMLYGPSVTIPDDEFIKHKHRKGYINYLIQSEARHLAEMDVIRNKTNKKKRTPIPYEDYLKMVEEKYSKFKAKSIAAYSSTRGLGLEIMEEVRTMGEGDRMFFAVKLLLLSYVKPKYRKVVLQPKVEYFINDYHPDHEGYLRETLGPVQY